METDLCGQQDTRTKRMLHEARRKLILGRPLTKRPSDSAATLGSICSWAEVVLTRKSSAEAEPSALRMRARMVLPEFPKRLVSITPVMTCYSRDGFSTRTCLPDGLCAPR